MAGMRKWVVAGVALVVICVIGYFLDRPRLGTVEYHKKQFVKHLNQSRLDDWVEKHGPARFQKFWADRHYKRLFFHMDALVELGYLDTRTFIISNSTPKQVARAIVSGSYATTNINRDFSGIQNVGPDSITILGPRDEMQAWGKLIREADVPEK
jgi:hypothetical protein